MKVESPFLSPSSEPETNAAPPEGPPPPLRDDTDLEQWCAQAPGWIQRASQAGNFDLLQSMARDAEARADVARNPESKALLDLTAAMARTALFHAKKDRKANGKKAFLLFKEAFELAPNRKEVATAFAQTEWTLSLLRGIKRMAVSAVGISVDREYVGRVLTSLARFPDDPMSQLLRVRLAAWAKDATAQADAQRRVDALQKDPRTALELNSRAQWLAQLEAQAR